MISKMNYPRKATRPAVKKASLKQPAKPKPPHPGARRTAKHKTV